MNDMFRVNTTQIIYSFNTMAEKLTASHFIFGDNGTGTGAVVTVWIVHLREHISSSECVVLCKRETHSDGAFIVYAFP